MKPKNYLENFKTHLQADGRSSLTIEAYLRDLKVLIGCFPEKIRIEDITVN